MDHRGSRLLQLLSRWWHYPSIYRVNCESDRRKRNEWRPYRITSSRQELLMRVRRPAAARCARHALVFAADSFHRAAVVTNGRQFRRRISAECVGVVCRYKWFTRRGSHLGRAAAPPGERLAVGDATPAVIKTISSRIVVLKQTTFVVVFLTKQ